MRCQSSSVAITPASASQVASPGRRQRRQLRGTRVPDCRSRTASATIAVTTASPPRAITAFFSVVGATMNRVSTSMRADNPGCAGTFRSVKTPPTAGFFSGARVPVAPGMPTKSAPATPASAQMCSTLQAPPFTAGRAATAATESRNATTTAFLLARTNNPFLPVWNPLTGNVENTRPPSAGRVAIAAQGMETSSARGAPDTSGAVISVTWPSPLRPCGHRIVAVVCFTGSSGTSAHSSAPAIPATTAIQRAS